MQENLTGENSRMYSVRLSPQTLFRDDSFKKLKIEKEKINIEIYYFKFFLHAFLEYI